MMIRGSRTFGVCTAIAVSFSAAHGALAQSTTPDYSVFGISAANDQLMHYDPATGTVSAVGAVRHSETDAELTGIEASAYVPTLSNVFGFWTDPADGHAKLLYISTQDAKATPVGIDLGPGTIHGAVAVASQTAPDITDDQRTPVNYIRDHALYAVQVGAGGGAVEGTINVNPNNSPRFEFNMTTAADETITRDDLHRQADIQSDGTLYRGGATRVWVKPKSNGNTLVIGNESIDLRNNRGYLITGDAMTVRVYNDRPRNGKAMGHWYLHIDADSATVEDGDGNRIGSGGATLVRIDTGEQRVQNVMNLSHEYDSLAAFSSSTFYATVGNELYVIDTQDQTEQRVGTMSLDDVRALEAHGDTLFGFANASDVLASIDTDTAETISTSRHEALLDLRSIVFRRNADKPITAAFD